MPLQFIFGLTNRDELLVTLAYNMDIGNVLEEHLSVQVVGCHFIAVSNDAIGARIGFGPRIDNIQQIALLRVGLVDFTLWLASRAWQKHT